MDGLTAGYTFYLSYFFSLINQRPGTVYLRVAGMAWFPKLILTGFLALGFFDLHAQNDSTILQNGLPVSSVDSVRNFPSHDYYPKNSEVTVPNAALPHRLLKALRNDPIYLGWEKLPVLYNRDTQIYTVRVITKSDTAYYGLNDHGKPVSYGKKGKDDQ